MSPATAVGRSARRRRLRRFLFVVALVPSILLLLLSARIVLLLHHEDRALQAYEDGDFEIAREHFVFNQVLNPVEPWLAPLGEGDALYRLGELEDAVAAFERSLRSVPEEHECLVRVNLALTHEAIGDAALEAGNPEDGRQAYLDGLVALGDCVKRAQALAEDDPLLAEELRRDRRQDAARRGGSDAEDDRRRDVEDRDAAQERWPEAAVRVDRRLARKAGENTAPPTRDREEAPPEDEATREKRRELQQRNRQAEEDRVRHQEEFDSDAPPPPEEDSDIPQW